MRGFWTILALILGASDGALAQAYLNYEALTAEVKKLAASHPEKARVWSLAKSTEGRDVWVLELGAGDEAARKSRPAMLVVAGAEGTDLPGSLSAMAWAMELVAGAESSRRLLDNTTIHVIPRLNVDAPEGYFQQPRLASATDSTPRDDDHDGLLDEDGPDDLNGDGKIGWMRIEDPKGEWIAHPDEPRVLIKADSLKGERGKWRLVPEGRDDDGDERWNEDGRGGVNLNRNFPYNYAWFATESGDHQLSHPVARALADFVIARPNIALAFTFGETDNLLGPPKSRDSDESNKPATGVHSADLPLYQEFGKRYREALGVGELGANAPPGTLADWLYFHRGRLSLAARSWTPALAVELAKKSAKPEEKKEGEKDKPAKEPDKRAETERAYLKWLDAHDPAAFVPWTSVDLPGRKAEVGGLAAFAETVPPASAASDLAKKQAAFLSDLAGRMPRLSARPRGVKHLGNNVFEVTMGVENSGYLPSSTKHGDICREIAPTRLSLDLPDAAFLAGTGKVAKIPTLPGNGASGDLRYVLHAGDRAALRFELRSEFGGVSTVEVPLNR